MFENAYRKQPANEELGAQTFFANVRTGNWKSAQQVMYPSMYLNVVHPWARSCYGHNHDPPLYDLIFPSQASDFGLLGCDEIAQAIPRTALSLLERDERSPSGI